MLPETTNATLVGRIWRPGIGPALVRIDGDRVIDITGKAHPTMADLLATDDPANAARAATGEDVCAVTDLHDASTPDATGDALRWLSPTICRRSRPAVSHSPPPWWNG